MCLMQLNFLLLAVFLSYASASSVDQDCSGDITICNTLGQFCDTAGAVGSANTCQLAEVGYYASGDGTQVIPGFGKCSSDDGNSCYLGPGSSSAIDCPAGTFSQDSSNPVSSCTTCDPNAFGCGPSSPGTCAAGYYGTASSFSCTPCSPGRFKSAAGDNDVQIDVCLVPGAGKCASSNGFSCSSASGADEVAVCSSGTYNDNNSNPVTTCSICPAGSYCPDEYTAPIQCAPGQKSDVYATSCTACPNGKYSAANASTCTTCAAGKYCADPALAQCLTCEAGKFSESSASECTDCPNGKRSAENSSTCTPCTAGKYLTDPALAQCQTCEAGKYSGNSASECTDCTSGKYSAAGAGSCSSCAAGYYCPDPTLGIAIPCPSGTYSTGSDETSCTQCPPGYACSSTASADNTACVAGTFSLQGQGSCTPCAAGFECPSTTSSLMTPCSAGYYSLGGKPSCTQCPAGSYCPSRASAPVSCPAGTYSSDGAVICTSAPAGYYTSSSGSASLKICASGYYSTGGASSCSACNVGYLCSSGSTSPTPLGSVCSIGGYCNPSSFRTNCPAGTYGVLEGGTSSSHACTNCEPGYYCPSAGMVKADREICPHGHYCPMGTSNPIGCPSGTYSPYTAQNSIGTCITCSEGKYCSGTGNYQMTSCPQHHWCPAGTNGAQSNPCPPGKYVELGGQISSAACVACLAGHYCPGNVSPIVCPAGTYNSAQGIDNVYSCTPCNAGFACVSSGMTAQSTTQCSAGYYCPAGTESATQYPCPAGTYSDSVSLTGVNECTDTEAGSTSTHAATSSDKIDCLPGHYCPIKTGNGMDIDCPAGRYSNTPGLTQASECTNCPAGSYCLAGTTAISGPCAAGFYCPAESYLANTNPCPAGKFSPSTSLTAVNECTSANAGNYVPATGSSEETPCPAGTYSGSGAATACDTCPAGKKCVEGTHTPVDCGIGFYSDDGAETCIVCPKGKYCGKTATTLTDLSLGGVEGDGLLAGICFAGTLCPQGMAHPPVMETEACPAGHYCPVGATDALPCPPGTYNSLVGQGAQSDCSDTPAGHYSESGATSTTGTCAPGFYCPVNSSTQFQEFCPPGKYRAERQGTAVGDCGDCPIGSYCPAASFSPLLCPRGYFCPTGTSDPEACLPGTYGNIAGLGSADHCTDCDAGYYCDTHAMQAPAGMCAAGYYCHAGSDTMTPATAICDAGYYCPMGSATQTPCPTGKYRAATQGETLSHCTECTPGSYCETIALTEPTGLCDAGYYCTGGAETSQQHQADPGYFAPQGSWVQTQCNSGTWQVDAGQGSCDVCTAGFYCPTTGMASLDAHICISGHYCPEGSVNPTPCPAGTYYALTGIDEESDCTPCDAGKYCALDGLSAPTGDCAAGSYCTLSATTAIQSSVTATGGPCGQGKYCLVGSGAASPFSGTPCPVGTYFSGTGNDGVNTFLDSNGVSHDWLCTPCDNSRACLVEGLTSSTGAGTAACDEGHFCDMGAGAAAAQCDDTDCVYMYGLCPIGHKCPIGVIVGTPCPEGTYQDTEGNGDCKDCTAGYFCDTTQMTTPVANDCPPGSYCPTGSINPTPCPPGTFSTASNLEASEKCTACTAGYYCETGGLTEPTGPCAAGSYCTSGAITAVQTSVTETGGPCPAGQYCLENSIEGVDCPIGTYMPQTGNDGVNTFVDRNSNSHTWYCQPCNNGRACTSKGLSSSEGNGTAACAPGHFCDLGAELVAAQCSESTCQYMYGVCPAGYKCEQGVTAPVACPPGTFQAHVGRDSCDTCTVGYYCDGQGGQPVICPAGSYCPEGTRYHNEYLCQVGTYSSNTGLQEQGDCENCAPGSFCSTLGVGTADDLCEPGYYCKGGSDTGTPVNDYVAGVLMNDVCGAGKYCPEGSSAEIDCPPGRASPAIKVGSLDGCPLCEAGYYCPEPAQTASVLVCPSGSYCPAGTANYDSAPSATCPAGSFCVEGSETHELCPGGTYQDQTGQSDCEDCRAGYYCPTGATAEILCPAGSYCPAGASINTVCDPGTYSTDTGLVRQEDCTTCPESYYCNGGHLSDDTCAEGYFCKGGSDSQTPTINLDGYPGIKDKYDYLLPQTNAQCPPGHYCPAGITAPIACPSGTVYMFTGAYTQNQCGECPAGTVCQDGDPVPQDCPLGSYCPYSEPVAGCPAGKYGATVGLQSAGECTNCPAGFSCDDVGIPGSSYTDYPCKVGHYCPGGGADPEPCPGGTYLATTGHDEVGDCTNCDQYKYCPEGSSAQFNCPEGMYCAVNSASGVVCPPGTYCPEKVTAAVDCPTSYYCVGGQNAPTPCFVGTYCPLKTPNAIHCPIGYYGVVGAGGTISHLGDLATACDACPAGKYGNDGARLECYQGTPGYLFYGGTTGPTPLDVLTEKGEICPKGHYCPAGSSVATPCPAGYYQPDLGAVSIESCKSCEANSYQYAEGSATCLKCSSSASSDPGATECLCVGGNRSFQPEDGRCICNPGYEFVDADFQVSSEDDGAYDCQPVVYARCGTTETRNSAGKCVDTNTYCFNSCGGSGGKVSASTGICECNIVTPLEQICNEACRNAKPVVSCTSDGKISVYDPVTATTDLMAASEYTASSGKIDCSVPNSKIVTMDTTAGAFAGVFGAPTSITSQISDRRRLSEFNSSFDLNTYDSAVSAIEMRRQLSSDPVLTNPAVCLNVGDSIVFDITSTTYPVYVKDSLLNTNPEFDYSSFRNLQTLAQTSQLTLTSFVFTFSEDGTYVFQLSSASESLTIISILGSDLSCGTASSFAELNGGTLITLGVKSSSGLVMGPDWPLVIGLVIGMVVLTLLVISFLYYFRKKAWPSHQEIDVKYRKEAKDGIDLKQRKGGIFSCLGSGNESKVHPSLGNDADDIDRILEDPDALAAAAKAEDAHDVEFEDDMLIPELAKHIQAQHDDVASKLEKNKKTMDNIQNAMIKEIDDLKALLNATAMQMSSAGGSEAAKAKKLRALLQDVKKSAQDRNQYMSDLDVFSSKMKSLMDGLQKLLLDGPDVTATAILNEIIEFTKDAYEKDSRTNDFKSDTLDAILEDLAQIVDFDKKNREETETEERRISVFKSEFKEGLNTARVAFPQNIMEMMNDANKYLVNENDSTASVEGLLHAFAERTPKFTYKMDGARGIFGRAVRNDVEMGNDAALDGEFATSKVDMVSYIEDLIAAIKLVQGKMGSRIEEAMSIRADGLTLRNNLIAAIDIELGYLPNMDMSQDITKLLSALQRGGIAAIGNGEGGTVDIDGEPVVSTIIDGSDTGGTTENLDKPRVDEDVVDDIVSNQNLSMLQKEELLEKAQSDLLLVDMQMQREKAQQEQMQKNVKEKRNNRRRQAADETDSGSIFEVNEKELAAMKKHFEGSRDIKIAAMERVEYAASIEADSPHDVRLATLAVNRYVAALRCLAVHARMTMFELYLRFKLDRIETRDTVLSKLLKQANPFGVQSVAIDLDPSVLALEEKEEKAIDDAKKKLNTEFQNTGVMADHTREQWLKDPASVDVDAEIVRLRTECASTFAHYRKRHQNVSDMYEKVFNREVDHRRQMLDQARKYEGVSSSLIEELEASVEKEVETSQKTKEQEMEENSRRISAEEFHLGNILNICDTWGPKVDYKGMQSKLFERMLNYLQLSGDMAARISAQDLDLHNEFGIILAESELNKRGADKREVESTLQNLEDAAKESKDLLRLQTEEDLSRARETEVKRQDESYIGYEPERALAVIENSFKYLRVAVDTDKSMRKVTKELRNVMDTKRDDLVSMLDQQSMTADTKDLAIKQVHNECLREDFELRAAFNLLKGESAMILRYGAEVVEGLNPSTDLAEKQLEGYYLKELGLLKEALVYDNTKRAFKKKFTTSRVKELEQMRIMASGRPVADLEKVESFLDAQLNDELDLIQNEFYHQSKTLEENINDFKTKKMSIHSSFHDEVYMILSDAEHAQGETQAHYEQLVSDLEGKSKTDSPLNDRNVIECNQEYAASICEIQSGQEDKIYYSFKEFNGKFTALSKVEDSIRQVSQQLQQKAEASENVHEGEKIARFHKTMQDQLASRSDAMALKNDYELALDGLNDVMEGKKKQQSAFLKERLAKKKKANIKRLVQDGKSEAEAEAEATAEYEADLHTGAESLQRIAEADLKLKKEELVEDYESKQKEITSEYNYRKKIAEDGLLDRQRKEKEDLKNRLRAKREHRFKELTDGGMVESQAKKQVIQEIKQEESRKNEAIVSKADTSRADLTTQIDAICDDLASNMDKALASAKDDVQRDENLSDIAKAKAIAKLDEDYATDLARLKEQQERAKRVLEDGLKAAHDKDRKKLLARLAKTHDKRVEDLKNDGMSAEDASSIADSEISEETVKAKKDLAASYEIAKGLLEASCSEDAQTKLAKIKMNHEDKVKGMNNAIDVHRKVQSKLLKERLARKKALRKKMLQNAGIEKEDIDVILREEFADEVAKLNKDVINENVAAELEASAESKRNAIARVGKSLVDNMQAENVKHDEAIIDLMEQITGEARDLHESERKATASKFEAIRDAALANSDDTDEALNSLRRDHEAAVAKLQDDFKVKSDSASSNLKKKLAARRAARTKDVEIEIKKENPSISVSELADKVQDTISREEKQATKEMEMELKEQEEKELAALEKRKNDLERKVIERERMAAELASEKARQQEEDAQGRLKRLREEQEREQKRLLDQMSSDRKSNDAKLKQRLADKRAKKMADMQAMNASAAQRAAEEARIAEEEHKAELEAARIAEEEKEALLAEMKRKQKQAEEDAAAAAQAAEVEAAIAASKQAALDAVKQTQERAERELNQRELARMKQKQLEEAEKAEREKTQGKTNKRMKLEERLKAKREKKERELADQEAKQLAQRAEEQAKEAEEKDRLRREKMVWSEHLAEAQEKAKKAGLGIAEAEDFCIKETIGKKLVSAEHMTECVTEILSTRQGEETSKLLEVQFEQRMAAIKEAATAVVIEKKEAMVRLMSRLEDEEASEDVREQEKVTLESEYQKKQLAAEKQATAVLEQQSMKGQMDLHQRQLEEISRICLLHSDPETMAKLQESTGKSKIEEMADYRAKLQEEQREREAAMLKEREEAESKMRAEMEKQMAEMKAKLKEEADKAEAEYAKQKEKMDKELEARKKEMESKKQEALRKGDVDEQARIKASFEKEAAAAMQELDAERTKKKNKLQERLAAKRKNAGSAAPPKDSPPEAMKVASAKVSPRGPETDEDDKKADWNEAQAALKVMQKKRIDATSAVASTSTAISPAVTQSLSALEKKMDSISSLLQALEKRENDISASIAKGAATLAAPAAAPTPSSNLNISVMPAADEPSPGQALRIVSDSDLHVQQRARLEFGYRVADLMGFKGLTLVGASSLPTSTAANNAFCNSYLYDHAAQQLAIHTDRMSSSGDFGLVIIHALSHIKIDPHDMSNDANSAFTLEFYSNLKILSQDLYKHTSKVVPKLLSASSSIGNSKSIRNMTSKLTALTGSIKSGESEMSEGSKQDDSGTRPTTEYFSTESLTERLKNYAIATGGESIPPEYIERYSKNQESS